MSTWIRYFRGLNSFYEGDMFDQQMESFVLSIKQFPGPPALNFFLTMFGPLVRATYKFRQKKDLTEKRIFCAKTINNSP